MTFSFDTSGYNIDAKIFDKALVRTLNDTAKTVKSEISKVVRAYYNIKKKDLDPKMKISKATKGRDEAIIKVTSRPIGLIHFNATQSIAKRKGAKTYYKTSAKILKQSRKGVVKGAFIGKAKGSNSLQVFRRTTDKQYPIIKLSVISPTSMVNKEGMDTADRVIKDKFNTTFERHYKFYASKAKR